MLQPGDLWYDEEEPAANIRFKSFTTVGQIGGFLDMDPCVGTFEWYDLLDKVDGDKARGDHESYTSFLVDMEAEMRTLAWEEPRPGRLLRGLPPVLETG